MTGAALATLLVMTAVPLEGGAPAPPLAVSVPAEALALRTVGTPTVSFPFASPALSASSVARTAHRSERSTFVLAGDGRDAMARLGAQWRLGPSGHGLRSARVTALELDARAGGFARTRGGLDASARLLQRTARSGRWLGVSAGGAKDADGSSTLARLGLGVWRWLAPFEVEVGVTSEAQRYENDSRFMRGRIVRVPVIGPPTLPGDSIPRFRDSLVTEFDQRTIPRTTSLAAVRWRRGRFEAEAAGGVAVGPNLLPRRWAQSTLRVQLDRRVQVMASFGERAAGSLAFDPSAQPRTMVGVQVSPWAGHGAAATPALRPVSIEWKSRTLESGRQYIRVRCRNAERVELASDFTDWQPVTMLPVHANWWALALPIEPGVHRVRVRLDGGPWMAPAGLPRADEGGEPVGLFVVE